MGSFMLRKLLIRCFQLALTICVIYAFSFGYVFLYSLKDDTKNADAAIVLGASAWGDHPSPVLKGRVDHSIWLYKNGYVKKIIFTGGKYNEKTLSESYVSKQYAIKHGVDEKDIFIEEQSKNTEQNLKFAKEIMKKEKIEHVLLVSDPIHMKRAMTIASFTGIDANSSPTTESAYQTWDTKLPFLKHEAESFLGYVISYPFLRIF